MAVFFIVNNFGDKKKVINIRITCVKKYEFRFFGNIKCVNHFYNLYFSAFLIIKVHYICDFFPFNRNQNEFFQPRTLKFFEKS